MAESVRARAALEVYSKKLLAVSAIEINLGTADSWRADRNGNVGGKCTLDRRKERRRVRNNVELLGVFVFWRIRLVVMAR